jgi:hypothetical protein
MGWAAVHLQPRVTLMRPGPESGIATQEQTLRPRDRLHQAGVRTGLGAFNPPGTRPPLIGLAVPEDFALPPGYLRHHQATDDGQRIEAILMFDPDHPPPAGRRPAAGHPGRARGAGRTGAAGPADPADQPAAAGRARESPALKPDRLRATLPSPATLIGLLAGALLLAAYARGGAGWVLGFVALVPWLWVLDRSRTLGRHAGWPGWR